MDSQHESKDGLTRRLKLKPIDLHDHVFSHQKLQENNFHKFIQNWEPSEGVQDGYIYALCLPTDPHH